MKLWLDKRKTTKVLIISSDAWQSVNKLSNYHDSQNLDRERQFKICHGSVCWILKTLRPTEPMYNANHGQTMVATWSVYSCITGKRSGIRGYTINPGKGYYKACFPGPVVPHLRMKLSIHLHVLQYTTYIQCTPASTTCYFTHRKIWVDINVSHPAVI